MCYTGSLFSVGSIPLYTLSFSICQQIMSIILHHVGLDLSVDDDYADSLGGSSPEKDVSILLPFARKIWLPVVFVVTVLLNLGHPVALATKAFLFLLSTKPSPLSVYIYVEQVKISFLLLTLFCFIICFNNVFKTYQS